MVEWYARPVPLSAKVVLVTGPGCSNLSVRLLTVAKTSEVAQVSKNAIREHAVEFAHRFKDARSEQSERHTFWNELFALFGVDRKSVGVYEQKAERASTGNVGWIDLLVPAKMAVEHKSAGEDLEKALGQLIDYLPSLPQPERPWLLVSCDFQRFLWRNLETGETGSFKLAELPDNLELFWWLAGYDRPGEIHEPDEILNLRATDLMAKLYDTLQESGFDEHELRQWLTRILFCLFADDTGVWPIRTFAEWIEKRTAIDGNDLGTRIEQVFQVLNQPEDRRPTTLDEDLVELTYINGDLFADRLSTPSCNEVVRAAMIEACHFDWSRISPAIFGSMFQNVMLPSERRMLGAHYTSEQNILRTIRPLFLDELEAELAAANTRPRLDALHGKMSKLTFLDPACGCGNFLVISYREIRRLESELLRKLVSVGRAADKNRAFQRVANLEFVLRVKVDQFYGIEIEEFPARIARTAMYLIDHIANREVSAEFGEHFARFPIPASPHITIDNALQMDWSDLLPAEAASYVYGNPPFIGQSFKSVDQGADLRLVWGKNYNGYLDYVTGWFAKAAHYGRSNERLKFAFVATNSISQGMPVAALWEPLLASGYTIDFAHRTFGWTSEARGRAHVHVVIIGFSKNQTAKKRLFSYQTLQSEPTEATVSEINPYLVAAPTTLVKPRRVPLVSYVKPMVYGNKPVDDGGLIVENVDLATVQADLIAAKYLRPLIGSVSMLNGQPRWCLWLVGASPQDIVQSTVLTERARRVRDFRLRSPKARTRDSAKRPTLFDEIRQPTGGTYLAVPCYSSATRRVVPMMFQPAESITNNLILMIPGATLVEFGFLQSAMFMDWLLTVGGRMKSDPRISAEIVYNTFPFPESISPEQRAAVSAAAQAVLDARSLYPTVTLADLYNPLAAPPEITKAHDHLDAAVDAVFAPRRKFANSAERLALLFERYEAATATLLTPKRTPKRRTTNSHSRHQVDQQSSRPTKAEEGVG